MKGIFHAKTHTIKDRNGMDLTEAEDIKKRWQEHTRRTIQRELNDPVNHDGAITQLEPDILAAKAMAPHPSTLVWKTPWTEEPDRLQSMGSRRVRHD